MVQAAAQAQAVVAAAKNRGGGLVPMNSAQIAALSQIQAQAIVNARPQTALLGAGEKTAGEKPAATTPTTQQLQNQIQLQAQALVHAHTQAQISAGIYKGEAPAAAAPAATPATGVSLAKRKAESTAKPPSKVMKPPASQPVKTLPVKSGITLPTGVQNPIKTTVPSTTVAQAKQPTTATQHTVTVPKMAQYPVIPKPPQQGLLKPLVPTSIPSQNNYEVEGEGGVILDPTSEEFLSKLNSDLTNFWTGQLREMHSLGTNKPQNEQDFKNHNDLPLARIKRIMKSDEDVRMIAAEAPVLFAKACEMFILEMTLRSWHYSENNRRKTLTKDDVRECIGYTDIFDFLVDVIH